MKKKFMSCKKILFNSYLRVYYGIQVLVVQALRPDRLQSAMSLFASKALGKTLCFNLREK